VQTRILHSSPFPTPLVKLHRFSDCRPQKVNGFVSLHVFIRSFALRHPRCRASIRTLSGSALPQSAGNTGSARHNLVERRQENRRRMLADEKAFR
jgi:hypothetical protein